MPGTTTRPSAAPAGQDRPILVVEDNVDAQFITTSVLKHVGYDVVHAGTLAEAEQIVRSRTPSVVVLDCRLPDGDGLELAQRWRKDPSMRAVPIIVLTAFSARQDVEAALLAGADAFLVKPASSDALLAHVARLVGAGRPSQGMRA